jgi:hypothetical protein
MSGKAIGIQMNQGFPGTVAKSGDCVIANKLVGNSANIDFGMPVYADGLGGILLAGALFTMAEFVGIAVRNVKTPEVYNPVPAMGYYAEGQNADVLERGEISVVCNYGTPLPGGAVYVRQTLNGAIPSGTLGGFEATLDGANQILLTNCKWSNGVIDANKVTALTVLTRNLP